MKKREHIYDSIEGVLRTIGVELIPEMADMLPKRKPGGQPGNQNARKHDFYSRRMSPEQLKEFKAALQIQDMSHEIALLRIRLDALLNDPDASPELIHKTISSISKFAAIEQRDRSPEW